MSNFCVLYFFNCGVTWGGLCRLPEGYRIAWKLSEQSIIERREFFQEPARIEDLGVRVPCSHILVIPGRSIEQVVLLIII